MNRVAYTDGVLLPFKFEQRDIPHPPPGGAIVKVSHAGLCQSDIGLWKQELTVPDFTFPWIPGHEIAGTVYCLGEEVDDESPQVGEKVIVHAWWGCRKCVHCNHDDESMCQLFIGNSIGISVDGGFQQFVLVKEAKHLVKVEDSLDMEVAALLPCSGLTAFNAVSNVVEHVTNCVNKTDACKLLIVGAGGLGLWATAFAKAMLPSGTQITVADISKEKLFLAEEAGADSTILWDRKCTDVGDLVKQTIDALGGPAEACIDFVNTQQTAACLLQSTNQGAHWVMVGLLSESLQLTTPLLVLKKLTIRGVATGDLKLLKKLVDFVSTKKITAPPIEKIELDDLNDAMTRLRKGKVAGRCVIHMDHSDDKQNTRF